jgi:hypothetical protein
MVLLSVWPKDAAAAGKTRNSENLEVGADIDSIKFGSTEVAQAQTVRKALWLGLLRLNLCPTGFRLSSL